MRISENNLGVLRIGEWEGKSKDINKQVGEGQALSYSFKFNKNTTNLGSKIPQILEVKHHKSWK